MKTARVIHPRNSRCALCGKSKDQVEKLIVGLHGAVCTDCVELCNDIVDPSRAKKEVDHENPFEVLIAREPDAQLPCYQTSGAAGMDLRSIEEVELQPMQRMLVRTGLRIAIPPGFEGQVRPRSGLALKHGITMVNSPGTIDSDYRGEVAVIAINLGQSVVKLERGERIAQLVIAPVARAALVEVESLDETDRGDGGFGSTGTR